MLGPWFSPNQHRRVEGKGRLVWSRYARRLSLLAADLTVLERGEGENETRVARRLSLPNTPIHTRLSSHGVDMLTIACSFP